MLRAFEYSTARKYLLVGKIYYYFTLSVICLSCFPQGIGNELMLIVRNHGTTQWLSAPLPRLNDKIHGIDFRAIESDTGMYWSIAFHAGREAFSIRLNEVRTRNRMYLNMINSIHCRTILFHLYNHLFCSIFWLICCTTQATDV